MHFQKTARNAALLTLTMTAGIAVGAAWAAQPHMSAAMDALRTARTELVASTPNKGGHREKAIQLVNQAIDETRMGMNAAR
jgi:hypothetical protein